jgi:hypothetical protein
MALLSPPAVPRFPASTPEYDASQQNTFTNVLRLYLNLLTNAINSLFGLSGGKYLEFPYGAFSSDQSQSTTANTAALMTLNTTDFSNGVTIASSKITVANAGIYNLQFSAQVQNLDNAPQDLFIWLKQNGTDIVGSTGKVGIPARKSASVPSHDIKGWNYFVSMAANDYIEIYWSPTIATVTIEYYAASGTPTKPSTQSVVATMSFVSALR